MLISYVQQIGYTEKSSLLLWYVPQTSGILVYSYDNIRQTQTSRHSTKYLTTTLQKSQGHEKQGRQSTVTD